MCAMFNIIKKTVFLFGIFVFMFASPRAATSLFEEARQECRGIYQSSLASEEDTQQWAEMNLATLSTLEDQGIVDLARTQCPPSYLEKTIPQMREGLQTFFTNASVSAQQNIKSYHFFLESLGSLTPETIEHHYLVPRLKSIRAGLQDRTQNALFPRTLPSDMETHSPYNKKLAEDAILRRANEALAIKVFGRTLPPPQLEKIFNPFVSHEDYGGHFLVLHAYVLDLIPSPPLPDHYQYRVYHNVVQALRGNPLAAFVVPGAVKEVEKARAQLAGPLKEIQELELSVRTRLKRYKENQITAEDILMEKVLAILTSTITDEVYNEVYKQAIKAKKQKERKKAAERRKKQQAREAKLRALSESTPEAKKSAETPASFLDSSAEQAQAGPAEDESFDQLTSAHEIPSALPLKETSPEDSSSESEEAEETFEYKPFVKQPAFQAASSAAGTESIAAGTSAAASASILTLKPRIYKIWEDFWSPGIRWMEWDDFTQLFMHQKLGFGIRPVGGSVRNISYPSSLLPSRTGKDHFMVHEPHGRTTLGPSTLRNIRSQLAEDLGWSGETFQSE